MSTTSSYSENIPAVCTTHIPSISPCVSELSLSDIHEVVDPLIEPTLRPSIDRFTAFPIIHSDIWDMYKVAFESIWSTSEVDTSEDLRDWEILTSSEQHFIKHILAFFAASDGLVMENLALRFFGDVQWAEARAFYGFQIAIEQIHSEQYSILIDTYIQNEAEKKQLFNAIETFPCIRKKAEWTHKWINDHNSPFAKRLVAFAIVEGIFFSGAFASIYWLKSRGIMHGLTFSNELIARDEALHTQFAVLMYSKIERKLGEDDIHTIVREAVNIEHEFICEAISCKMIGMNVQLMHQYIEFVADRLCVQLGYKRIYNTGNPFNFMELISIETKANFFERTVSEYAISNNKSTEGVFDDDSDYSDDN